MRKSNAIAFLLLFGIAQYAKQLIYLDCKISNNFKSLTEKCDCVKVSGLDKQDKEQPVSNTHNHLHLDEFYPIVKVTLFDFSMDDHFQNLSSLTSEDISAGYCGKLLQPPKGRRS